MMCFANTGLAQAWMSTQQGYRFFMAGAACCLTRDPTAQEIEVFFHPKALESFTAKINRLRAFWRTAGPQDS